MLPKNTEQAFEFALYLSNKWEFEYTEELTGGHCSVAFANEKYVLKVPFRGEEQATGRIAALRMSGLAGPVIHKDDPTSGSLLMDRIIGINLSQFGLDDHLTMPIFFQLIEMLKNLSTEGLTNLNDYYATTDHSFVKLIINL